MGFGFQVLSPIDIHLSIDLILSGKYVTYLPLFYVWYVDGGKKRVRLSLEDKKIRR